MLSTGLAACFDDGKTTAGSTADSNTTMSTGDTATQSGSASSSSSTTSTASSGGSGSSSSSSSTSSTSSTTDPTSTTGGTGGVDLCKPALEGDPCDSDRDCAISGDCCGCIAYNPDMTSPGNCGGNCKSDKCDEWGLTSATCEAGICVVKGKSCDPTEVSCNSPQPDCDSGTLPQVDDGCYTGKCLPVLACDWVPDCDLCDDLICVITEGPGCTHHRCEPGIAECEGEPPCDCLGSIFCNPPHSMCSQLKGALLCEP